MENNRNVQPRLESNVVVSTERELPPRRDESEIPTRILEPIVFKTQYNKYLSNVNLNQLLKPALDLKQQDPMFDNFKPIVSYSVGTNFKRFFSNKFSVTKTIE